MSISTESTSSQSSTLTSSQKNGFAEQLLKLRQQQELQYRTFMQKYQEQQDMLRQQQQQELQLHYNRQKILNSNHKNITPLPGFHTHRAESLATKVCTLHSLIISADSTQMKTNRFGIQNICIFEGYFFH